MSVNFQTQETLRLISLSPVDGEETADLAPVIVLWEAFDPVNNPLDVDEFEIERDGNLYPVIIEQLGAGLVRLTCEVGIFPDETITLTARAQTIDGVAEEISWTFTSRLSFEVETPAEFSPSYGTQTEGDITASLSVNVFGSDVSTQGRVGLFVRVPIQAEDGLAHILAYEFAGSHDDALARITPAISFSDLGIPHSFEIGDLIVSASPSAMTVGPGQPPVIGETLSFEVRGVIRWGTIPLAFELGYTDDSRYNFPVSLELGEEIVTASLMSLELQRGAGLLIFLDLLSSMLSKLRE